MKLTEKNLKAFCDSIASYSPEHKKWADYLMKNLCRPGEVRARWEKGRCTCCGGDSKDLFEVIA